MESPGPLHRSCRPGGQVQLSEEWRMGEAVQGNVQLALLGTLSHWLDSEQDHLGIRRAWRNCKEKGNKHRGSNIDFHGRGTSLT